MGYIKSAWEIAKEKTEQIGQVTDEERLRWQYVPEGERLAVKFIKEDCNLVAELVRYEEPVKKYIIDGAVDILVRHIGLPKNNVAKKNSKKAMEGLKTLKKEKVAVENVFSRIRQIFEHYGGQGEQQRKQAYESLKLEFATKLQQAAQQQGALNQLNIDVSRLPQFQEEWRKLRIQLDLQYTRLLDEYKQELLSIP